MNFLESIKIGDSNYCILLDSELQDLCLTTSDIDLNINNKFFKAGLLNNDLFISNLTNIKSDISIQIDSSLIQNKNQILGKRVDIAIADIKNAKKLVLYRGYISNISYTNSSFRINISSILSKLSTPIGNLFSPVCRANFGDNFCKINLDLFKVNGKITEVYNISSFKGSHNVQEIDYFKLGYIRFISGTNASLKYHIKNVIDLNVFLIQNADFELRIGDEYELYPSCDKSTNHCKKKFNNIINFRGEPFI